jgi:hypothetical protein
MNTDSAKIIAEKIKNGKTDLGSDPTLLKAWKETATKSGSTNTSNNTAPGFTQSKVERTDGKNEWNIKMGDTIIKIDQT